MYVQSLRDAGTRRLVSSGGGGYPRWGPDGRELNYRAADGRLMTVPVRIVGSSVELGTPAVVMRLVDPLPCIRIRTTSRRTAVSWR